MTEKEKILYPLETEEDLDILIKEVGDINAVLIGSATHGTSEFYTWRSAITRRLINEKGFTFVAVEGDWPACYQVNRYVKDSRALEQSAREVMESFRRWPTWMWANREVQEFIEWLAQHNEALPAERRVGFYGLDVYSLWESLAAAVRYLENTVPEAADIAKQVYRRFEPQQRSMDGHTWTIASIPEFSEDEVARFLSSLEHLPPTGAPNSVEEKFNAEQNGLVALDAERYYKALLQDSPDAWNLREAHMANTFFRLMDFYEETVEPKGIIWAHNAHVGDAQATDLAGINTSIGEIIRGALGTESTYIIGFGTNQGRVIASDDWESAPQEMELPPAIKGSWESVLHELEPNNKMAIFTLGKGIPFVFQQKRDHRSVGVVYDPNNEYTNYTTTTLREQYDSFIYIDTTTVLHPLNIKPTTGEPPGTFPSAA